MKSWKRHDCGGVTTKIEQLLSHGTIFICEEEKKRGGKNDEGTSPEKS